MDRSALYTEVSNKILTGGRRTTGLNTRDVLNKVILWSLNKDDDADANGGYLSINSSGYVNVSFIKKVIPTGEFLRDDGTWATAGTVVSGTQNYIAKFNPAGNNVIISSIYDNGSAVGIGTNSPTGDFEVFKSGFTQSSYFGTATTKLRFEVDATTAYIGTSTNQKLIFRVNGNAAMNIGTDKFVAIGVSTATAQLHVRSTTFDDTTYPLFLQNSSSVTILRARSDGQVYIPGNLSIGTTDNLWPLDVHANSSNTGLVVPFPLMINLRNTDSTNGNMMSINFQTASPDGCGTFGMQVTNHASVFSKFFWTFPNQGGLKMVLNYTGYLGVGVETPSASVHAKGTGETAGSYGLKIQNGADAVSLYVNDDRCVGIAIAPISSAQLYITGIGYRHGIRIESDDNGTGYASIVCFQASTNAASYGVQQFITAGTAFKAENISTGSGFVANPSGAGGTVLSGSVSGSNGYGVNIGITGGTGSTAVRGLAIDADGISGHFAFFSANLGANFTSPIFKIIKTATALNGFDHTGALLYIESDIDTTGNLMHIKGNNVDKLILNSTGDLKLPTVGSGIYIKEGSNATMGRAVLVGGTVTVNTTKVTNSSEIFLTENVSGGTLGSVYISARVAGTSFTITSLNVLDTSTVSWIIMEPA